MGVMTVTGRIDVLRARQGMFYCGGLLNAQVIQDLYEIVAQIFEFADMSLLLIGYPEHSLKHP